MRLFDIIAILISLSAVFSWLNYRVLKLPTAIGLMLSALLMSLVLQLPFFGGLEHQAKVMLASVDFDATLLHGMLSFLLFAGAMHVNLNDLAKQRWVIGILSTVGVVGATFLIGGGVYYLFAWLKLDVPFIYCLLFGSLISPTDPIAVLGILKSAGAPKTLETKITGESLFNDGVAVVVFLVLADIATGDADVSATSIATLFFVEAIGGLVFGLLAGSLAIYMLKRVDNYQVEVLFISPHCHRRGGFIHWQSRSSCGDVR